MKYYLDNYALVEITNDNKRFHKFFDTEFIISDLTLADFYRVLLRKFNQQTAEYWAKRLNAYSLSVAREVLFKAIKFKHKNKEKGFSFFDCVGYTLARERKALFVTGDEEFRNMPGVEFIKA